MAKQTINIGASANDGTGDTIRTAFSKANDNFTELYDSVTTANSVATDTSPQLGGDLDVAGFSIVSNTGTGIINIVPSSSGYLRLDGITIDGTTVSTHTNNTNITLDPNGTGKVLASKIAFTGGTLDGVTIGGTTPATGTFGVLTVNTALQATGGSIDSILIGATTPAAGTFTSVTASTANLDLINMAGNIIPTTDVARNLGSVAKKWNNLYVNAITANSINLSGGITGTFTGNLTGNVTGDVTGNVTGNASTATALQNSRTINGVSFDGTANITVPAAAGTLTGTTLNSTVTASSLTSVGTLTSLTVNGQVDVSSHKIVNVTNPTSNQDAATKNYVDTAINDLINGAPAALNTLKEIADSLNNDTDIATTVVNGLATKLDLAGGTLTGALTLAADPTSSLEAATKSYVDSAVAAGVGAATTISSDDTSVVVTDDGVSDGRVDVTVDGNIILTVNNANIDANSTRIINLAEPSAVQDAVTKNYVDTAIDGLAAVASSGQYTDILGTPSLATVAITGSYNDLTNAPDLTDFVATTIYANTQIHSGGGMLTDSLSVFDYAAIGDLSSGSSSLLEIRDLAASGASIAQIKNNLLAISSVGDLSIQGLVYPATDGTAGQVLATDGSGVLSFASYLPLSGGTLTGKLLAAQGSGTTGGYSFGGSEGGADTGMFSNADGVLDFYADNNKMVTVTSSGLVSKGILTIEDGVQEVFQTKSSATGTVTHDCSLGQIFYHTTPSADWTINLTNLNLSSGKATTVTCVIVQGATARYPSALQIGGAAQTINWQGNATPTPNANRTDVVSFSILNNSGTYLVLGQLTGF